MSTPVFILCGGLATRLGTRASSVPKIMLDINGKTFLEIQLQKYAQMGITTFIYITGHMHQQIEDEVARLSSDNSALSIEHLWEGEQSYGTGGALRYAFECLDYDSAFITYGDNYLDFNIDHFDRFCRRHRAKAVMTVFKNDNEYDRSNVDYRDRYVVQYCRDDKNRLLTYIDYGFSYFTKEYFLESSPEVVFDLSSIFVKASEERSLLGFEVSSRFYEIGSVNGLDEFRLFQRNSC